MKEKRKRLHQEGSSHYRIISGTHREHPHYHRFRWIPPCVTNPYTRKTTESQSGKYRPNELSTNHRKPIMSCLSGETVCHILAQNRCSVWSNSLRLTTWHKITLILLPWEWDLFKTWHRIPPASTNTSVVIAQNLVLIGDNTIQHELRRAGEQLSLDVKRCVELLPQTQR